MTGRRSGSIPYASAGSADFIRIPGTDRPSAEQSCTGGFSYRRLFRHILKNACSLEIQFLQNLREEELEELPEGELNFHREIWQIILTVFSEKSGDCNRDIPLFVISRRNPECVWGMCRRRQRKRYY